MELNDIVRDTAKIDQGAWIGEIPEMGELRLKVRGTSNSDFQRMMQKLVAAVPRAKKQGGRVDPIEMDRIMGSCAHATLLLDWEGVKVNGELRPYDRELAFKLCTDPAYQKFVKAVTWAAGEVDELTAENEKADAGN